MSKTFGALGWAQNPVTGAPYFGLSVPPHVAIKAKRVFPRLAEGRTDLIHVLDTPEVAADIEWFLLRYPMEMAPDVATRLRTRAAEWRESQERIEAILRGEWKDEHREPARKPRPYQSSGAALAYEVGGLLLGDEVGLGKTQTATMLLGYPGTLPALIVVPAHLTHQWQKEVTAVYPDLNTHIVKTTKPYAIPGIDVVISSYSKLAGWRRNLSGVIKTVIFDEVQELRRQGTDKYDAAGNIADKADRRMGLSASPIYNYGGEAWNIYNILAPDRLGTSAEFYREWGGSTRGANIIIANPNALGEHLRDQGVLLRRTRQMVGRELPAPIEDVIEVDSHTDETERVHLDVVAMADRVLNGSRAERFTAAGELDMRMRQATGIDKAPFVADFGRMLLESEEKIVMFGWHRAVYSIWNNRLHAFNPVMYTGSESPRQKNLSVEKFVTDPASRIFICSLRSGAGLDGLQEAASVAVFGELDWSPAIHHQALGRLAREGQPNTAVGYYLVSSQGSDPIISGVLEEKRQQAEPFMAGNEGALFTAQYDGTDRIKRLARSILDKAGR